MTTTRRAITQPGECTRHAKECGAGVGVFYLVEKCNTLLLVDSRACYYPSLYVDEYGECSTGHNRPLYLSKVRFEKLQALYSNHEILKEIVRIRLGERSVIRHNFY